MTWFTCPPQSGEGPFCPCPLKLGASRHCLSSGLHQLWAWIKSSLKPPDGPDKSLSALAEDSRQQDIDVANSDWSCFGFGNAICDSSAVSQPHEFRTSRQQIGPAVASRTPQNASADILPAVHVPFPLYRANPLLHFLKCTCLSPQVHLCTLLGHHHAGHSGLWGPVSCQPRGSRLGHCLHVFQPCPGRLCAGHHHADCHQA